MSVGQWFSYNKDENVFTISSVDFLSVLPFLRGRNFLIKELFTFKNGSEISLLIENEPAYWVKEKHHIKLSHLLEENDNSPICYAIIELEQEGAISYIFGKLVVKYPSSESLMEKVIELLIAKGYFAGSLIWNFCNNNNEEILLDFVLGMEETDVTDEFERMLEHNRAID